MSAGDKNPLPGFGKSQSNDERKVVYPCASEQLRKHDVAELRRLSLLILARSVSPKIKKQASSHMLVVADRLEKTFQHQQSPDAAGVSYRDSTPSTTTAEIQTEESSPDEPSNRHLQISKESLPVKDAMDSFTQTVETLSESPNEQQCIYTWSQTKTALLSMRRCITASMEDHPASGLDGLRITLSTVLTPTATIHLNETESLQVLSFLESILGHRVHSGT